MQSREGTLFQKTPGYRRFFNAIIVLMNIALLTGVFLFYARYTSAYQDRLKEENLGNIANLNQSAATNAMSLIGSWGIKLDDIARYVELHALNREETLKLISQSNSSQDRYFELIGEDYTGFLARENPDGTYPPLDYSSSSYAELHKVFQDAGDDAYGQVRFAPEFTDGGESALKFFAIYKHLPLRAENGQKQIHTLLLAAKSRDVLDVLNGQNDYVGQSTVLMDGEGNYIVSNRDFKSANFFQYLYVYNDLTMDQRNAVRREMEQNGSGELYYKNAGTLVEDCVFRYERMEASGWYCVTCVPLSSFRAPAFNITYIIYAVVLMAALFTLDMVWLQRMNRRLRVSVKREAEASAAKGNFMSRMSHEIRTPLNAIIGYNTIARNEMAEAGTDEERKRAEMKVMDCLLKSDIAGKHLLTIINDVLDMSAIESGNIKIARDRFDFRGLITSLTTIFYSQAKVKGVEFEVVFGTLTEEWFIGDQMRVNQILTNLISNAVKFTPEGGAVKLTIRQPEAGTNAAHIHFEVTDTGIGMTEEYLSHIWTPFEQADSSISRRFGGTGLGLAITKNLVDLMHGTILVKSTLGEGTTFGVDLTFERTEQPKSGDAYDFSKINALVVDDDPSSCDYIRLLFARCGARCATVTSGADALTAIRQALEAGERYTVCLVDWRMPGMDGIETVRRMRQITGDETPIVILTAYDYTELADKAADVGINRFISKPLFQSSLFDLLATVAGKREPKALKRNTKYDFSGARVLLAEDNAMNMEIAKRIMESAGLTVDGAWNGKEAVEAFEAAPAGAYTAILMDVHMPVMSGHEATRAIRASGHPDAKTVPIIAMTADAFAENVAEALAAGMNGHISKPIDVQKLFELLHQYIASAI